MHYRMRRAGYRFYFSPDIVSWHAARKSAARPAQPEVGQRLLDRPDDADSAALLCTAPSRARAVCAGADRVALLCPLSPLPLAAMLLLYGALDVLYAAKAALEAPRGRLLTFICLPFLFPVVHIVYGTGTLCGLLTGKAESHA